MEEELYAQVVDRLLAGIYHALQHQVCLLQLVVEEQIILRESHLQRVCTFGKVGTQHVQPAEHPAASARLLVGNRLLLGLHTEVGIQCARILLVLGQCINSVGSQRITQRTVRRRRRILFLYLLQHLLADTTILRLGTYGQRTHQHHA